MTASTLYEAVEPQLLWKHVLTVVFDEITGDGTCVEVRNSRRYVKFVLTKFTGNTIGSLYPPNLLS